MKTTDPSFNSPQPRRLLRLIYKFILISLAVHLVGIAIFGGYVVLKKLQPEEVVFTAPPTLVRVEPKKRQYKLRVKQQQQRASRPKLQPRLQSTRMSPVALPQLKTKVEPIKNKSTNVPGMSEALGEGLSLGGGLSGGGMIFGVNVTAKKLGVILDVSFSTHDTIHLALEEIERSFPDAILVLVPGCGMVSVESGKVYEARDFESKRESLKFKKPRLEIQNFLFDGRSKEPGLLEANPSFQRFYAAAQKQGRVYILQIPKEDSDTAVKATQDAFEFLIKQGVDGIYWFADFEDKIEPDIASQLIRTLSGKNIKVYQHVLNTGKAVDETNLSFAKETQGEVIRAEVGDGNAKKKKTKTKK